MVLTTIRATRPFRVKRKANSPSKSDTKKAKTTTSVDMNKLHVNGSNSIEENFTVDELSNPLYELMSNDFKSKDEFTTNDLAAMFKSLAITILNLQKQNSNLQKQNSTLKNDMNTLVDKVTELENHIQSSSSQSKENPIIPTTMVKSFASVVASSVTSSIATPESQLSIMKAASYANTEDSRRTNVILKNMDLTSDAIAKTEFATSIASACGTSTPSVFCLPQSAKGPPIVRLTFKNKEEASTVLTKFNSVKASIQGCLNASPRPDLSKPELQKYRQSWKTAIKLNNERMQTIYTVRNLEVVKINYRENQEPWPWTKKHSIVENI